MSDLVGNPEARFSRVAAQIKSNAKLAQNKPMPQNLFLSHHENWNEI